MGNETRLMPIHSTPGSAVVSIVDESGTEIFSGTTPTSVPLQKGTGRYCGKKSYPIKITKPATNPSPFW